MSRFLTRGTSSCPSPLQCRSRSRLAQEVRDWELACRANRHGKSHQRSNCAEGDGLVAEIYLAVSWHLRPCLPEYTPLHPCRLRDAALGADAGRPQLWRTAHGLQASRFRAGPARCDRQEGQYAWCTKGVRAGESCAAVTRPADENNCLHFTSNPPVRPFSESCIQMHSCKLPPARNLMHNKDCVHVSLPPPPSLSALRGDS